MKQFIFPFLICSFLFTISCQSDDPEKKSTIKIDKQSIYIPALGGEQLFQVEANVEWSVNSDVDWIKVSKETATTVKIKATMNMTGAERSGKVRCSAEDISTTVNVTQAKLSASQNDSLVLVAFYNATNGANWSKKWTLSSPIAQWEGVSISSGRIVSLKLPNNNLQGTIPEELMSLSELNYIDIHQNTLNGKLPDKLGNLTKLQYCDLSENSLTGTIPSLTGLAKIILLDLSHNQLTGNIPASLRNLTTLEYLSICNNKISGTLPSNLNALIQLNMLDFSFNNFTGSIPSEWSALNKLQVFYLYKNSLEGSIPAFLTYFTNLTFLALDGNNLTGSIPDDLGNSSVLNGLWLAQNRLTGNIPDSLLENPNWSNWKAEICPQQNGYGFNNCSSNNPVQQSKNETYKPVFKEKYRR